jgi:hypothetical protein
MASLSSGNVEVERMPKFWIRLTDGKKYRRTVFEGADFSAACMSAACWFEGTGWRVCGYPEIVTG